MSLLVSGFRVPDFITILGEPWGDEDVMNWIRNKQASFWDGFEGALPFDECLQQQHYYSGDK